MDVFLILVIGLLMGAWCTAGERSVENIQNVTSAKLEEISPVYGKKTVHTGFSIGLKGGISDHYSRRRYLKRIDVRFYVEYSDKKPRHVWVEKDSDDYYELMKYVKDN